MKQKSVLIGCYATFIFIGGLIGYFVAQSFMSLVMSSIFAALLLICSIWIWRGHLTAYSGATGLIFCLFAFFGYRFFITMKFMPSGLLALMSLGLLLYLLLSKKQMLRPLV